MVDFRISGTATIDPDRVIADLEEIIAKMDETIDKSHELSDALDEIGMKNVTANVKVDITGYDDVMAKLDEIELKTRDREEIIRVNVDGAAEAVAELKAVSDEENKLADAEKKAAKDGGGGGGLGGVMGLLLGLLPAAVPILAATAAGIVGLGGAFAVMAPGLIGVFAALKPTISSLSTMQQGLTANTTAALATAKSYSQVHAILDKNSAAFRAMNPQVQQAAIQYELLKNAYSNFQNAVNPAVIPLLTNGMKLLEQILAGLPNIVTPAANAIDGLISNFSNRLKDPTFKTFFSDMKSNIGTFVTEWGTGILNIIEGLTALFHDFMPISQDMSKGFENMTASFMKWAENLGKSKGFQEFIEYVKTYAPIVLNIINQLVTLIVNVVKALAGFGGSSLKGIDDLLKILNNFAKTNPQMFQSALYIAGIGFAASKLLPIVSALGPALMTLFSNPWLLLLIAVGGAFLAAYLGSKKFHDFVNSELKGLLHSLSGDFQNIKQWASSVWPDIQALWKKDGQNIINIVSNIFQGIEKIFSAAIQIIEGAVDIFLGLLEGKWSLIGEGIKKIAGGIWQALGAIFTNGGKIVLNIWEMGWHSVSTLFDTVNQQITNGANWLNRQATNIMSSMWHGLVNLAAWGVKGIYNSTMAGINGLDRLWSDMFNALMNFFSNSGQWLWNAGYNIMVGFYNGIISMWNKVAGFFSGIGGWIQSHKGPPAQDAILLTKNGELIMQGFHDGLKNGWQPIEDYLNGITKTIEGTFGSTYTSKLNTELTANLRNVNSHVGSMGIGAGVNNSSQRTNVNFSAGSIVVNNPSPETASNSLTRTMTTLATFGMLQAPVGSGVSP